MEAAHGAFPPYAANLPVVPEEGAPPEVEALYAHFRSHFGRPRVPGILQCFATHPPLLEHMIGLAKAMLFTDGALGRRQKEMLATYLSACNRCDYCADSHGFALRMHGGSEQVLAAALSGNGDSPALTPAERALLAFAGRVNESSFSLTPADIEALRHHGFTDLAIAETIHLTALFAAFNRVVNGFGLPSQNLLEALPAPPREPR